mgnify:CR=1 FL=1
MAKSELRTKARERWGKDWHKCHPLIKKARLAWCDMALSGNLNPKFDRVHVHEGGCSYVV